PPVRQPRCRAPARRRPAAHRAPGDRRIPSGHAVRERTGSRDAPGGGPARCCCSSLSSLPPAPTAVAISNSTLPVPTAAVTGRRAPESRSEEYQRDSGNKLEEVGQFMAVRPSLEVQGEAAAARAAADYRARNARAASPWGDCLRPLPREAARAFSRAGERA